MQGFKIVGMILSALLAIWIVWSLSIAPDSSRPPVVADLNQAFEANAQLPLQEIESRLKASKARMMELNSHGRLLKGVGEITGWVSFACTAAITLILGYFGRSPAGNANPPIVPDSNGLPNRIVRIVGVLAALASILTAAGSMAKTSGQERFDRSNLAAQIIREAQRTVGEAPTAREQQDALEEMTRKVDQL